MNEVDFCRSILPIDFGEFNKISMHLKSIEILKITFQSHIDRTFFNYLRRTITVNSLETGDIECMYICMTVYDWVCNLSENQCIDEHLSLLSMKTVTLYNVHCGWSQCSHRLSQTYLVDEIASIFVPTQYNSKLNIHFSEMCIFVSRSNLTLEFYLVVFVS